MRRRWLRLSRDRHERRARRPLAGLRIVAVEQFGAGPFGTLLLADLGAEVIKVEDPGSGGDVSRYIPPVQEGTDSLYFEAVNRNKRSVVLDLKNEAGREVFERLVAARRRGLQQPSRRSARAPGPDLVASAVT